MLFRTKLYHYLTIPIPGFKQYVDEGWFVMSHETELQDCQAAKFQLENEYPKLGMILTVAHSCNWQHSGQVSYSVPLS
jgi:hypothetical protein